MALNAWMLLKLADRERPSPSRERSVAASKPTIPVWMAVEKYKLLALMALPILGSGQTSNPFSRAKSLSEVSGRAPRCWITSAAASAPSRAAVR